MSSSRKGILAPQYNLSKIFLLNLAVAIIFRKKRSFSQDSIRVMKGLQPPFKVSGRENIPLSGPCLITVNHYSSPSFFAIWLAFAISSLFSSDIHWITTRELTYSGQKRAKILRPLTRWGLTRISEVYGFTIMPPMPPDPRDQIDRGIAVRQVLHYIQQSKKPIVAIAPEGTDFPGGKLGWPLPGTGKFIAHISGMGLPLLPVGVFEQDGYFKLSIGAQYRLPLFVSDSPENRDREISRMIMSRIAKQLPRHLQSEEFL